MTKSALRFLILASVFEVAVPAHFGDTYLVYELLNWSNARKFCREHHTDLSSVNNHEEIETFLTDKDTKHVWIGLYKDADDTWKWSGGEKASIFKWSPQPNTSEVNRCVLEGTGGWRQVNCERKFYFLCFHSRLLLVKENKTWEQAMEHCREMNTELVSLPSEFAQVEVLQSIRDTQTDRVWTNLRYLGDSWLWVDGTFAKYEDWSSGETPQCPAWNRHCGALSLQGGHWDSWDCADKLNFFCY